MFRHGLAFSLKPGPALHRNKIMEIFQGKIERFNEYIRANATEFSDMEMWHYDVERSKNYSIRAVPPELSKPDIFIFIGKREKTDSPDIDLILRDFCRLLLLYRFVEGKASTLPITSNSERVFKFQPGHSPGQQSTTTMTTAEQTRDMILRHNDLQEALHKCLVSRHGKAHVGTENPAGGGGYIDLVVKTEDELIFYEIKTDASIQSCIRDGIGQLLEYSFWGGRLPCNQARAGDGE